MGELHVLRCWVFTAKRLNNDLESLASSLRRVGEIYRSGSTPEAIGQKINSEIFAGAEVERSRLPDDSMRLIHDAEQEVHAMQTRSFSKTDALQCKKGYLGYCGLTG